MNLFRRLWIVSLAAAWLAAATLAYADVPPTCSQFDNDVTCSTSDVGKACSGGGTCYEVYCSSQAGGGGTSQNLYKCETCPTVLDAGADACVYGSAGPPFGASCAGTGTCEKLPEYCPAPNATLYLNCVEYVDAGAHGHGSSSGSSSGGGCTMTQDASRGYFTAALGLLGVVALGLSRRRRG
jgi:MYXO-CTERM domain-containing protein